MQISFLEPQGSLENGVSLSQSNIRTLMLSLDANHICSEF